MLFTNLVQANLKTKVLGRQIEYYTRLESTNSEAWEIINEGTPSGTIIVTDNQFKGKGRNNRKWLSSPNKSLTFSIIITSNLEATFSNWIPIISALAINNALSLFNIRVKIKYPNDLIIDDKKIGGILCESKIRGKHLKHIVIGIGINVNERLEDFNPEILKIATSMQINSGKFYQRERILAEILNEIEPLLDGLPSNIDLVKTQWEAASNNINQTTKFMNQDEVVTGIFKSLNSSGNAIINIDGKEVEFFSGEII